MIESTGDTYQSSQYAKTLAISHAKVGKSCFLIGGALGLLPWQKFGGIVDKPEHLHVMTFDANALGHVNLFLKKTCGAPDAAFKYHVINMQDDLRRTSESQRDYDMTFYNLILSKLMEIWDKVRAKKGVHALIISSLTGLAQGVERGLVGPPGSSGGGRGYADRNKWTLLSQQLNEVRNYAQIDGGHTIWEAHLDQTTSNDGVTKETIRVRGEAGRSWGYNVEQVFKIQRSFGKVHAGTKCDLMHFNTKPTTDFIANGRGFNELLGAEEPDISHTYYKLGLTIGQWGRKSKAA
jgi:hypothetical protein